jgi:hypothetical protein
VRLERKDERPAPAPRFYLRLAKYVALCLALAVASLGVGMLGYRHFEEQSWPEAFLNAAMLLAAMGPVSEPQTTGGKVFAGCYALYCGLLFLVVAGLLVTPFAHRLLHLFHSDPDDE